MSAAIKPLNLCVYENRLSHATAFKLLLLSLKRHQPTTIIHTFENPLIASLDDWLKRRSIHLQVHSGMPSDRGWSIKPFLLRYLLDTGLPSIVWLDADVIVIRPFAEYLARFGSSTVIATEEPRRPFDSASGRAQVWGDPPRRTLSSTLNSALVHVSAVHRPMIDLWCERLCDNRYLQAQGQPAATRPAALFSDQDVLEGLLVGRFHDTPTVLMKQGAEIIQDFWMHDYTIGDRLKNALGWQRPMLVHGQSLKPWDLLKPGAAPHPLREYREVGVYAASARPYRDDLDDPDCDHWLNPSSTGGRRIDFLVQGSPHLGGAVLAARDHTGHFLSRGRGWLAKHARRIRS